MFTIFKFRQSKTLRSSVELGDKGSEQMDLVIE